MATIEDLKIALREEFSRRSPEWLRRFRSLTDDERRALGRDAARELGRLMDAKANASRSR